MDDQEREAKKLLNGAKQEVQKQETKIAAIRKEIRRLEIENEKLRTTLKQKLNMKQSSCLNAQKKKASDELLIAKSQDEFFEMIKIGFVEQMTNANSEMRQTQEYSQVITRWVSDTFNVKLLRTMQIAELKQVLDSIDLTYVLNKNLRQTVRQSSIKKVPKQNLFQ